MTDVNLHPSADKNLPPYIYPRLVRRQFDKDIVFELAASAATEPCRMTNDTPSADSRLFSESSPQKPQCPGPETIYQHIGATHDIVHSQRHSPAYSVPIIINW